MKEEAEDSASNVVDEAAKEKTHETAAREGMDKAKEKADEAQDDAARMTEEAKEKSKDGMDKVYEL